MDKYGCNLKAIYHLQNKFYNSIIVFTWSTIYLYEQETL